MRTHFRRWLYLSHRWLGIGACLFFLMWFVSGVVMMYVGYPKLTESERLQHLPPLADAGSLLGPSQALGAAGIDGPLAELRLAAASGGRAHYFVTPVVTARTAHGGHGHGASGRGTVVIDAHSGAVLEAVDAARALASAAAYAGTTAGLAYLGTVDEDPFTHSRNLDAHRPLHRVRLADAASTLLYVSGQTGEVVRDAPRAERLWNYAGAWIHWLYPFRGGIVDRHWAGIVIWASIAGIALAVSGAVVGILRWRFGQAYRNGGRTPYRSTMMRWHHVSGLLFAVVTITWIFSGLMSMNPWRLFDTGAPGLRIEAMHGGPLRIAADALAPAGLMAAAGGEVRELRWMSSLGRTIVTARGAGGDPMVLDGSTGRRISLDPDALASAAARLLPDPVLRVETLVDYDLHYYAREPHTMTGGRDKPLPVLRLVFDDAAATWVHVDLRTGAVLGRLDSGRRASRWLFAMLHSWDWLALLERRPLWDLLLLAMSLGGIVLSASGVVIGWRRLGRRWHAGQRRDAA